MTIATREAAEVLDSEFLVTRGKILEVAAALDRIDRAPEHLGHHPDPRLSQIRQALEALMRPEPSRAETIQRIFSRDYNPRWQDDHGLPKPRF
jgi:hypothetical protein